VVLPIQLLRQEALATDRYRRSRPPMSRTTGGAEHQLPTAAKRWLPLAKWLLAFPHYILVALVDSGIAGHSARSPIPDRLDPPCGSGVWQRAVSAE
jgi:hypothetical protein